MTAERGRSTLQPCGSSPEVRDKIRDCHRFLYPGVAPQTCTPNSPLAWLMRRPASFLLGLSAAAALHPQLRLAAHRPLAVAARAFAVASHMSSQEDLSKRTVVQLKQQLRAAGLPVSGRKAELVDRLLGAGAAPAAAASSVPLASFASSGTVVPTNTGRSGRAYPPIAIEACKS